MEVKMKEGDLAVEVDRIRQATEDAHDGEGERKKERRRRERDVWWKEESRETGLPGPRGENRIVVVSRAGSPVQLEQQPSNQIRQQLYV